MAPHSSTLAWKIPWTEEPGRLQSMGSLRVGHNWATSLSLFTFMLWRRKWQPTPELLPGEFHGQRSLVVSQRVGHNWVIHFHFQESQDRNYKRQCLDIEKTKQKQKPLSNSERIIRKWKLLPWERKCLSRISRGPSAMNSVAMILILHGRRNKLTSTVFLWFCYVMLL